MTKYSVAMEVSLILATPILIILIIFLGLSPDLHDFEQIRSIARPTDVPDTGKI